jgi:hypothetical protein
MSPADLWAMLWGPGIHELYCHHQGPTRIWIPTASRRAFMRALALGDCYVSAVPRDEEDSYALGDAHVVWVRLERPESAERLGRLPVPPTVVIREGRSSRRWALWALSQPLRGPWIGQANERLAHAVRGRRGTADASTLILSPFTSLTVGRRTPIQVSIEWESTTFATARQIVGRLSDPPSLDSWRAAA